MIIMIGGIPCSGKSTLMRSLIQDMGSHEDVEPMKLFPCQKHGDTLVIGRYPVEETFGGTERISYGAISKFRDFINQEVPTRVTASGGVECESDFGLCFIWVSETSSYILYYKFNKSSWCFIELCYSCS